jgi:hypothetical protein
MWPLLDRPLLLMGLPTEPSIAADDRPWLDRLRKSLPGTNGPCASGLLNLELGDSCKLDRLWKWAAGIDGSTVGGLLDGAGDPSQRCFEGSVADSHDSNLKGSL